jgi:hypothetical protein
MKPQAVSGLPSRKTLHRFFRERRACSIAVAAEVTGLGVAGIRHRILRGEMSLEGSRIAWGDVALAFEGAWPMAIKEELVRDVEGYPSLLRALPVTWRLPAYLVMALEQQVVRVRSDDPMSTHLLSVEALASEELRLVIDDQTVAELRENRAFREAYDYPEEPE